MNETHRNAHRAFRKARCAFKKVATEAPFCYPIRDFHVLVDGFHVPSVSDGVDDGSAAYSSRVSLRVKAPSGVTSRYR